MTSEAEGKDAGDAVAPRADLRRLAVLFLGSRFLIWVVAGLSLAVVAKGRYYVSHASPVDWFKRWDAGSFLEIADHGYTVAPGAKPNVPFLPLYPLVARACSLGGLVNLSLAAQMVSLGCLWTACVLLWKAAARERRDARTATLAVAFLLFGPVSFFFSSAYSEGLFLALSIGCFESLRRQRWWLAGALGALASLTRFAGLALIVPLLWQALESARRRRPAGWPAPSVLLACLFPAAGFLSYCAFLWLRFGDFLLYFHVEEKEWGRRFAWFWMFFTHASFSGLPVFYQVWFAGALAVAVFLLLAGIIQRQPTAYSLYGLALVVLYISSRLAEALPRYLSVIFPLYIAAAVIAARWPRAALPLLAASALLECLSVVLFVNGYWFT